MYRTLMKNTKFISHILREIDEILSWNKKKIFSFLLFKLLFCTQSKRWGKIFINIAILATDNRAQLTSTLSTTLFLVIKEK